MIPSSIRPAVLPLLAAALGLFAALGAVLVVPSASAVETDVAVETHAARLRPLAPVCSDVTPVGRALSRQVVRSADHRRAVLTVQVRGLVCPGVDAVTVVVVKASGHMVRVGEMRIHDGGWGEETFATGAGDPIPHIDAGDGVVLAARGTWLMGGRFVLLD